MPSPPHPSRAPLALVLLAFAAVYFIWGSTFLAIKWGIEGMPPFFMAGTRFLTAGTILYVGLRLRGTARPTAVHWRSAAVLGTLMLTWGNGTVTWSEQQVPSALVALMIAMVPMWMVVLGGFGRAGTRPSAGTWVGLAAGLVGMVLLVGPGNLLRLVGVGATGAPATGGATTDAAGIAPGPAAALLLSTLAWSLGSVLAGRMTLPRSLLMTTAIEMLCGGVLLLGMSLLAGEPQRLSLDALTMRSVLSLAYLVVFGSIVAFTAYTWLLTVTTPARVSTYAYVNPVVAVALGAAVGGEALTARTAVAAGVIIAGVAVIVTFTAKHGGGGGPNGVPEGGQGADGAVAVAESA